MRKKIDLEALSEDQRSRVEKAMLPRRDTILSLRFTKESVDRWRRAADEEEITMTSWVETNLDEAVEKKKDVSGENASTKNADGGSQKRPKTTIG